MTKGDTNGTSDRATATIVGNSVAILRLRSMIAKVGRSRVSVMIDGPSGAGKELVARAIHAASDRADRPFVAINCGAIPSELIESELFGHERGSFTGAVSRRIGRFEEADGGTLFLDEIGDMPLDMQVKLLRVLEEGVIQRVGSGAPIRVDVRVVSATHRHIREEIAANRFREDLYFRLGVLPVSAPPLADRLDDIPALIAHFQRRLGSIGKATFSREALSLLTRYDWPGNVRELRNIVERAHVLFSGEVIGAAQVDQLLGRRSSGKVMTIVEAGAGGEALGVFDAESQPINLKELIEAIELERIEQALAAAEGVVSEAARLLTLKRTTLIEKMRKYRVSH